jgi:hypothetical protein
MSDTKYFFLAFKVSKTLPSTGNNGALGTAIITDEKLIQAQTELEAIAKYKLRLKPNEKYLSHVNQTIE